MDLNFGSYCLSAALKVEAAALHHTCSLCAAGHVTQGFLDARQALYQLSHVPVPKDRILHGTWRPASSASSLGRPLEDSISLHLPQGLVCPLESW